MIKYTPSHQLTLDLAELIPWDSLASIYAKSLSATSGRQSIDAPMVLGALIVKHKLGLDCRS